MRHIQGNNRGSLFKVATALDADPASALPDPGVLLRAPLGDLNTSIGGHDPWREVSAQR